MALDLVNLKIDYSDGNNAASSSPPQAATPSAESFNQDRLRELSNPEYLDLAIAAQPDLPSKLRGLKEYVAGVFTELSSLPTRSAKEEIERIMKSWAPGGLAAAEKEAKEAAVTVANPLASASDRMATLSEHKRSLAAIGLVTLAAGAAFAIPLPDSEDAVEREGESLNSSDSVGSIFRSSSLLDKVSQLRRRDERVAPASIELSISATDLINNISPFIFK